LDLSAAKLKQTKKCSLTQRPSGSERIVSLSREVLRFSSSVTFRTFTASGHRPVPGDTLRSASASVENKWH
jgi:hypothetical protein